MISQPGTLDTVMAGLNRASDEIVRLNLERPCQPILQAHRARRLSALHGRCARWWGVLERASVHDSGAHRIYRWAVTAARWHSEKEGAFWRDAADGWDRRCETEAAA